MKRIVLASLGLLAIGATATPVMAADLPPQPYVKAPAYVPPYYNWSGFYLGINGGYGFGNSSWTGTDNFSVNGGLVGGTVGFNYQISQFVLGIEGDFDYNSASGTLPAPATNSFNSRWLSTVRGRAGYAWDRVLLFATGGGAFAPANIGASAGFAGGSTTMMGWTAGAGIEFAFAQNWTAKAEYLYISFPSPSITGVSFKDTENVVRAGVNYKFNF